MKDMGPVILRHAITNSWANPQMDSQFLIRPSRFTNPRGARGVSFLPHMTIAYPETNRTYVGYEFGQLDPVFLGLNEVMLDWKSLDEICADEDLYADAYVNHRHLIHNTVWVRRTQNRNLIFAVEWEPNKALLSGKENTLNIRFYSNAWFATTEGQALSGVRSAGTYVSEATDASTLLSNYNAANYADSGTTLWFHNGFYRDKPTMDEIAIGDTLQYIWDSAGTYYFDVDLDGIASFTSKMDKRRKVVVMSPEYADDEFLYYDDVEFYICSKDTNGKVRGINYDRIAMSDVRQLTHRDWSLDAARINSLIFEQEAALPYRDAFIRVFVRKAVTPKRLVSDGNYLSDFYSIDYSNRIKILAGSLSVIDKWKASELEQSPYMHWLGLQYSELKESNLKGVYSFYGVEELIQKAVSKGAGVWELPEAACHGGLLLGFDSDGKLTLKVDLTEQDYTDGTYITSTDVKSVRVYGGSKVNNGLHIDVVSNFKGDAWNSFDEERYYKPKGSSIYLKGEYGVDYDINPSSKLIDWSPRHKDSVLVMRSARVFTEREFEMDFSQLGLAQPIFADGSEPGSKVPFGRLDVWLDGKRAVPGLDYVWKDFTFWISNRQYLDATTPVADNRGKVTVQLIAHGLAEDTDAGHYGFVVNGMVNDNDKVDLTNKRSMFFYNDGLVGSSDDLIYAENYRGDSSISFKSIDIKAWNETTAFVEGDLVYNDHKLYMAPTAGVPTRDVFTASDWTRVYGETPYYLETADKYYVLFNMDGKVKRRIVYENNAKVTNGTIEDVTVNEDYVLKAGLPSSNPLREGSLFYFEYRSNQVSRFRITDFTDTYKQAREYDKKLSAFIGTIRPQQSYKGLVQITGQHKVISITTAKLIQDLQAGTLVIDQGNISDFAVANKMRPYLDLVELDVCKQDTDFRFIEVYAHGELETIGLSSWSVGFLERVNQIYLGGRVNVTRDTHIA